MIPSMSVITPSFNQGRFIERTIQSVLSQDISGLEYVVVDGGSTDDTVSILRRYEDRLTWVSERDRGHSDAINKGIRMTLAPVVGWLNSDDVYYLGALRTVLACFDLRPEVQVFYGDAYHIDENDAIVEHYPTEEWNWERLQQVCFISQPATFLRRQVFDQYGQLDVSLRQSMDYEYWLRLGKNGVCFAHIPQILAATRLHKDAFTVAARVACHKAINDLTRRHLNKTPDRWIFNYAHAVVESKGFQRNDPFRFAIAVSLVSLYASLKWNRAISRGVLQTTTRWIRVSARTALREAFAR